MPEIYKFALLGDPSQRFELNPISQNVAALNKGSCQRSVVGFVNYKK